MSIDEATNSKVIRGTPLINSIKHTLNVLTTVNYDCLPRAKRMPIGSEQTIPVTPTITVSINPPKRLYSILDNPKYPPLISIKAIIG